MPMAFDLAAIFAGSYHLGPLIVLTREVADQTGKTGRVEFPSKEAFLMSKQPTTLGQLAELVGGRIHGNSQLAIVGAAVLGEVVDGEITLVDHVDRLKTL